MNFQILANTKIRTGQYALLQSAARRLCARTSYFGCYQRLIYSFGLMDICAFSESGLFGLGEDIIVQEWIPAILWGERNADSTRYLGLQKGTIDFFTGRTRSSRAFTSISLAEECILARNEGVRARPPLTEIAIFERHGQLCS